MEATARIYLAEPGGSDRLRSLSRRLAGVVEALEAIARDLSAQDLTEEAGSIATVVADLRWQSEELSERDRAD